MTVKVEDQEQCRKLMVWFNGLDKNSLNINEAFLKKYKATFKKIKSRQASNYSDISALIKDLKKATPQTLGVPSYQFFKDLHFDAYNEINWNDYSEKANKRREVVKNRFKDLHQTIYPKFSEYGMDALYSHYHTQSIVSSHIYRKGFNSRTLDAMWLHYGYSLADIPEDSKFILRPRVQIILRWNYIGIWLVIGKDNGSIEERGKLKYQLQNSMAFKHLFYQEVFNLGGSYWLEIAGELLQVSNIGSVDSLNEFIQEDDYSGYFIIGRDYNISDTTLSEDNISETLLIEFQRLYPLFVLVKHPNV